MLNIKIAQVFSLQGWDFQSFPTLCVLDGLLLFKYELRLFMKMRFLQGTFEQNTILYETGNNAGNIVN